LEILGVYHTKIIIFDNSVILTGANLAGEYFESRRDRYFLLNEVKDFADYLEDYIDIFMDLGVKIGFSDREFEK